MLIKQKMFSIIRSALRLRVGRLDSRIIKYSVSHSVNVPQPNDEVEEDEPNVLWKTAKNGEVKKNVKHAKKISESKKTYDMLRTMIDANGDFVYTKVETTDVRISSLLTTVKSQNQMEKKQLILLEGKRLINEALDSKFKLEAIIFSRKSDLEYIKDKVPKMGAAIYKMPYKQIQLWSDLTVCPGIMGIFHKPQLENVEPMKTCLPVTVICDNVREPGNLGALLRTCSSVGCKQIILTKGCVNLWNTKVSRGSSGVHFRTRVHLNMEWSQIQDVIDENSTVCIADNNLVTSADSKVESVAANIATLPLVPYYGMEFTKPSSIVLIIGGETEGISEEAYEFACGKSGVRLNIPLAGHVDSLNTGVALGVIVFEMKRQFLTNVIRGVGIV